MIEIEVANKILKAVDENFAEQLNFTCELVKFPSTRGQEQTAQDFMAAELRHRGFSVDRWRINIDDIKHLPGFSPVSISYENSFNVVGSHRAEHKKGQSLILNGHIDVVPEGPHAMWGTPPYEPKIDGDWLSGRGSGDMKAGLTSCLFAYDAIKRAGYTPASDVFIQSVVEEECTGNGALACLARGYRADVAVIPEPFDDALLTAQLGVMWFQVEVRGVPVHASTATSGANAIEAAFSLIQSLKELEGAWNEERTNHEHFADHHHPINFNIGKISGGDWASSVPAWCVFDMRVAIFPGDDLATRQHQIETCIQEAAAANDFLRNSPPNITYNGFLAEGYVLKEADDAIKVLGQAHEKAYGAPLECYPSTATTDARFFGLYAGIPALVYGPKSEAIHGFNERVNTESIRKNTQSIALFMADWCGLEMI